MRLSPSLNTMNSYAFANCTNLVEVIFKKKATSITSNAFYQDTKLTSIKVPWSSGEVSGAPWSATKATITYNYT